MVCSLILGAVAFLNQPAAGEELLPEAPAPSSSSAASLPSFAYRPTITREYKPRIDATTWVFLGTSAAIRGLDAYSTYRALQNGRNREACLPDVIAYHLPALIAFEAITWSGELGAVRFLGKRRHSRLARLVPLIDTIVVTPYVARNFTLPGR